MCHSKSLNDKINNICQGALRRVNQDKKSDLQDLLQKEKSVYPHEKRTIFSYRNLESKKWSLP